MIWDASTAPPGIHERDIQKGRKTMSEETKKAEKIDQEVKPPEVSDQDLDNVAAGAPGDPIQGIDVSIGRKPKPQNAI